jgi:hypothetical protein
VIRPHILAALLGVVLAACASSSDPPPAAETAPTLTAVAQRDDVRVTLTLDGAPARGSRWWARVEVVNAGARSIDWASGLCGDVADVFVDLSPAFAPGRAWEGRLGTFKGAALGKAMAGDAIGEFVAERRIGEFGRAAREPCAWDVDADRLPAGGRLEMRAGWDVAFENGRGAPPGPAHVVASFGYIGPSVGPLADPGAAHSLLATIDVAVSPAAGEPQLTPAQAVDVALSDPGFAAWVLERGEDTWAETRLELVDGTWVVGLIRTEPGAPGDPRRLGEVRIGPAGLIVSRRFRVDVLRNCPDPTVC